MDTKKIGAFLKQCRKEKNLTQEQLAEKFEVSARTVSRWETGINMPDLSILVQLAEYYDVEMRELLDGERSQTMNKEMKETLDKVAVYEEWVKQKALKAGNLAFASMFVISVLAIIIQMLLTINIRFILGETVSVLAGGILYASIMVYNGIWDKCLPQKCYYMERFSHQCDMCRNFYRHLWCMLIQNGSYRNTDNTISFLNFGSVLLLSHLLFLEF